MSPSVMTSEQLEIRRLKWRVARYKKRIDLYEARSKLFLRALNDLVQQEPSNAHTQILLCTLNDLARLDFDSPLEDTDSEAEDIKGEDPEEDQLVNESESEEEDGLNLPAWDIGDAVFRCRECSWEVLDGECHGCLAKYDMPEHFEDPDQSAAAHFDAETTNSAADSPDRVLAPRGDTPEPTKVLYEDYPAQYRATLAAQKSYQQLRSRGATVEMCVTYQLSFTNEIGIVAVLTEDLKEDFRGLEMSAEDKWELCLGRAVQLDADDNDGTVFITGLLEDVLLFSGSHFTKRSKAWETVRDPARPDVWLTRPTAQLAAIGAEIDKLLETGDYGDSAVFDKLEAEGDEEDQEDQLLVDPFVETGPTLHREEYEDSECGSNDSWSDDDILEVADLGYSFNARYDDFSWSDGEEDGTYSESEPEPDRAENSDDCWGPTSSASFTTEGSKQDVPAKEA